MQHDFDLFCIGVQFSVLLFSAICLWSGRYREGVSLRLFKLGSLLMIFGSLVVLLKLCRNMGLLDDWTTFGPIYASLNMMSIPMVTSIMKELTHTFDTSKKSILCHYGLPVLMTVSLPILCAIDEMIAAIVFFVQVIYMLVYLIYEFIRVFLSYRAYQSQLQDTYINADARSLEWIRYMLIMAFSFVGIYVASHLIGPNMPFLQALASALMWGVFALCIYNMKDAPAIPEQMSKTLVQDEEDKAALSSFDLPEKELEQIMALLRGVLNDMKILSTESLNRFDLARAIGISPNKLVRAIRQSTGMTLAAYVTEFRMERAAVMLANTELPVEQIIKHSGYNTRPAFYRAFTTRYGCTPVDYRRKLQNIK